MEAIFDDMRSHHRCSGRTGGHDETAKPESLADGQGSSDGNVVFNNETRYPSLRRRHKGTLNESTNVGVKTGGSQVGGPELRV